MKKKIWMFVAIILLVAAALFVYRYLSLPNYETPFQAEDVKSVRITKNWEYRILEDSYEIDSLVAAMNKIKIVSDFNESVLNQIPEGNIGYSIHFELVDGRQLDYSAATTTGFGLKFVDEKGTAYKTRNFKIGKIWNAMVEGDCPPIPSNFYAIYYQGKAYEGTATVMQVPKDAQLVGSVTGITYTPDQELECSWGKTGDKVYAWEENGIAKLGVEIEQDVWPDPQAVVIDIVNRSKPTGGAIPNNWGITLTADNVSSKGLTIVCYQSGGENVSELHTGSYYVLQKWEKENWVDVEYLPQEHPVGWTAEAWMIGKESATFWEVNWEWLYGQLPAGEYRIGKEITNFRAAGDYDEEMIYADFIVE